MIFCGVILLLSTMPPRTIAMATGPEGSGYAKRLAGNINRRSSVQVCRSDWWQRPVAWKTWRCCATPDPV